MQQHKGTNYSHYNTNDPQTPYVKYKKPDVRNDTLYDLISSKFPERAYLQNINSISGLSRTGSRCRDYVQMKNLFWMIKLF